MKSITNEILEEAGKEVENDETYGKEADLIKECFTKFPQNIERTVVAMKCGLIDVTNSTNLSRHKGKISLVQVVDILLSISNLDERIRDGDPKLIKEFSSKTKRKHNINLFSFMSKFCCYHNIFVYGKDDFVIYDTVLMEHLPKYINGVTSHKIDSLRKNHDYKGYLNIVDKILANNNITIKGKRRKLDNLIWYNNR